MDRFVYTVTHTEAEFAGFHRQTRDQIYGPGHSFRRASQTPEPCWGAPKKFGRPKSKQDLRACRIYSTQNIGRRAALPKGSHFANGTFTRVFKRKAREYFLCTSGSYHSLAKVFHSFQPPTCFLDRISVLHCEAKEQHSSRASG